MPNKKLAREEILQALRRTLEPQPHVHAMWEGGSEAFGRTDEWSDIDVQVDVDDEKVAETLAQIEGVLEGLSPIQDRLEMPEKPGYAQVFYRLRDASPFLLVDLCVMKRSYPDKFLEPEIHGRVVIHFNKGGALVVKPLDVEAQMTRIRPRREWFEKRFAMFHTMVEKEINRENYPAAVDLYYRLVLDSLIDALRLLHAPAHFDFKVPYLNHDLPKATYARLRNLFFVADEADLRRKYAEASRWFQETLAEIDLARTEEKLRGR
jgi:predicted nucleotidyltransferase